MKLHELVAATHSMLPKIMAGGECTGLLIEKQTRGSSISQSNQPSYPDLFSRWALCHWAQAEPESGHILLYTLED
jgi:hypothetical protein